MTKNMSKPALELDIVLFETPADWARWLEQHRSASPGLWVRLAKKGSGVPIHHLCRNAGCGAVLWLDR